MGQYFVWNAEDKMYKPHGYKEERFHGRTTLTEMHGVLNEASSIPLRDPLIEEWKINIRYLPIILIIIALIYFASTEADVKSLKTSIPLVFLGVALTCAISNYANDSQEVLWEGRVQQIKEVLKKHNEIWEGKQMKWEVDEIGSHLTLRLCYVFFKMDTSTQNQPAQMQMGMMNPMMNPPMVPSLPQAQIGLDGKPIMANPLVAGNPQAGGKNPPTMVDINGRTFVPVYVDRQSTGCQVQ